TSTAAAGAASIVVFAESIAASVAFIFSADASGSPLSWATVRRGSPSAGGSFGGRPRRGREALPLHIAEQLSPPPTHHAPRPFHPRPYVALLLHHVPAVGACYRTHFLVLALEAGHPGLGGLQFLGEIAVVLTCGFDFGGIGPNRLKLALILQGALVLGGLGAV